MARIDCFEPVGATVTLAVTSTTGRVARTLIGGGLTEAEIIALEGIVTSHLARIGAAV